MGNNRGPAMETMTLLKRVYVVNEATFPPKNPAITAAEVAVGPSTQIKALSAVNFPKRSKVKYTMMLPNN